VEAERVAEKGEGERENERVVAESEGDLFSVCYWETWEE